MGSMFSEIRALANSSIVVAAAPSLMYRCDRGSMFSEILLGQQQCCCCCCPQPHRVARRDCGSMFSEIRALANSSVAAAAAPSLIE